MNMKSHRILIAAALFVGSCYSSALADMLFQDTFESPDGLSAWTGKTGDVHHGIIVDDPLNAGNHVLTFTKTNGGGDIYSKQAFDLLEGREYRVAFDYLGLVNDVPGGAGGFSGFSVDFPGEHMWYYGTNDTAHASPILIDDGQWHHYEYAITTPLEIGDGIHLMFEDFTFWGAGISGDAYFDNITFHAPVPGALLLGSMGLSVAGWRLRKKKAAA